MTSTPTFTPTITPTPTITSTPTSTPKIDTEYIYDNNGNLISETTNGLTTSYSYDFENRLSQIVYSNGTTETYQYDYAGELVHRTTSQGTINYVYGQGAAPLAEIKDFGPAKVTDFIQINGRTVGEVGTSGTKTLAHFYHSDGTGNILGVTDSTGAVVESTNYDPFGVVLANATSGSYNTNYQYVGAYGVRHITTSGSQPGNAFDHSIMGVRMYDAGVGRFLSEDPLGFTSGEYNFYRYVGNSVLGYIDSDGLQIAIPGPVIPPVGGGGSGTVCDPNSGLAGAVSALIKALRDISEQMKPCPDPCNTCPPCTPYPFGTIGYRYSTSPGHYPVTGPHYIMYQVNQNQKNCKCFWSRISKIGYKQPWPGSVPVVPLSP